MRNVPIAIKMRLESNQLAPLIIIYCAGRVSQAALTGACQRGVVRGGEGVGGRASCV